jgi:hypothetical protein
MVEMTGARNGVPDIVLTPACHVVALFGDDVAGITVTKIASPGLTPPPSTCLPAGHTTSSSTWRCARLDQDVREARRPL